MKLKINKTNKYGDIQYVEHPLGNVDLTDLSLDNNWVVKNPSPLTVREMQQRIPDCELKHFRNTLYLISPKAVPYNTPTINRQQRAEMMVVTTEQQGIPCFILQKRPEKQYWQSFLSVVPDERLDAGQTAIAACKFYLDVIVLPENVTRIGQWELKFFYRPLIDFELWSTTHIFHTHLPEFTPSENITSDICFVPFQDLKHMPEVWLNAKLDGQQREVLNRVLGQPSNTRLPYIKNLNVTPVTF